jgi:hypothetical protein
MPLHLALSSKASRARIQFELASLVLIFLGMSAIAILSGDPDAAPLASDAYAASEGLAAFFRRVFVPYYRFLFTGHWPLTSYRLSSLGYDGKASGDDLCLSGSSRARRP